MWLLLHHHRSNPQIKAKKFVGVRVETELSERKNKEPQIKGLREAVRLNANVPVCVILFATLASRRNSECLS